MDVLTSQLGGLSISDSTARSNIVYLIGKNRNIASYFHPLSDKFLTTHCVSTPDTFEVGQLYNLKKHSSGCAIFTELDENIRRAYVIRGEMMFADSGYEDFILPSLLLGSRLRDYDQSCATVINRSPLILSSSSRPVFLTTTSFRTETGEAVEVMVEGVDRNPDLKTMKIFGDPVQPLPSSIVKGSHLQFCSDTERIPLVTKALEQVHKSNRSIINRTLLDRIYGKSGSFTYRPMDHRLISVKRRDGTTIVLNGEQSEAVHRYNSDCPAFAVESPPGTGKTMTAGAMAITYCRGGLQLFLSTANVPVFNMAIALAAIDYGDLNIVHLVSAEREATQERSPFSIFEADDEENEAAARFKELGEEMETASKSRLRNLKKMMRKVHAEALAASGGAHYDIILATVDMILGKLLKPKNKKNPCPIQRQLETDVRRIVIDEASQLTEAALNAIILCFPRAQIVLIGDSKQLPAFKYEKGEIVSEMAAHSALIVLSRKKNLPMITMRTTYRQSPSVMRHYSDVFYGGHLSSGKPESRLLLPSAFPPHIKKDLMFIRIDNSKTGRNGTSLINDAEIATLEWTVTKLRLKGYDHQSVMIIAYYEAQRKLAKASLPEGYEVLTVDSAQGREKDVVIVLTTRDSPTTTPFFTCPLRCNVAVSRHKRALIILGSEALYEMEPWKDLLKNEKKYFSAIAVSK
ncbi:hypothetical protein PRIPAC_90420 [Pristionchus pacificus]|uniref:Uncharacterized protein n=1 Tax=Pristionchus pacificus TaxID=54126 RepID=A0A2A6CZ25_PRIPA|nr:hypothetical protein PRIPAC_90420 [Pristionchus pacificus]|eukprot:PDM83360.1 hypothetical protein PRIPAC_34992 [Pristionchus pacificus]